MIGHILIKVLSSSHRHIVNIGKNTEIWPIGNPY
jgi:hypothetical protein